MKIKFNENKGTFKLTGLTITQLELINTLLAHVRLGDENENSEAAFEMLEVFENSVEDIAYSPCTVVATNGGKKRIDHPTIVFEYEC